MSNEPVQYINAEDAFFKLIKLGIGASQDTAFYLDTDGWSKVFDLAKEQALIGVVIDGVAELSIEQKPPADILMPWIAMVSQIEERNKRMNQLTVMVSEKFENVGMGAIVLKGQVNATWYPNPLRRMPGDIDLWMCASRKNVVEYVRRFFPKMDAVYHHIDFPVMKDTGIELHFTPSWMNHWGTNRRLQRFFAQCKQDQWKNKVELPGKVGAVSALTKQVNLVYLLVHIYRHLFDEGVGLRQLMDYYFLLRQGVTEEERKEVVQMLEQLRMTRFASAVMYVIHEVFGMEEEYFLLPSSKEYGERLLQEVMLAGNFGQYDKRIHHDAHESLLQRFCRKVFRNGDFLSDYPSEVIWSPLFKVWHYIWRGYHGYLPKR